MKAFFTKNSIQKIVNKLNFVKINNGEVIYSGPCIENTQISINATISYCDGNIYTGTVLNENDQYLRHGYGCLKMFSRNYVGTWDKDSIIECKMYVENPLYEHCGYDILYLGKFNGLEPIDDIYEYRGFKFTGKIDHWNKTLIGKFDTYEFLFEGTISVGVDFDGKFIFRDNRIITSISGVITENFEKITATEIIFADGAKYNISTPNAIVDFEGNLIKNESDPINPLESLDLKINDDIIIEYTTGETYIGSTYRVNHESNLGLGKFYRHGFGTMITPDNKEISCTWDMDNIKNGSKVEEKYHDGSITKYINSKSITLKLFEKFFKCTICGDESRVNVDRNTILDEDINPNNFCKICHEVPVNVTLPNCRHTFCKECILK